MQVRVRSIVRGQGAMVVIKCIFVNYVAIIRKEKTPRLEMYFLERVEGIEPSYSAWKADVIAIIPYPQLLFASK
jgi:hypothetical protein